MFMDRVPKQYWNKHVRVALSDIAVVRSGVVKVEDGSDALYVSPRHVRAGEFRSEDLAEGAAPGPGAAKTSLRDGDVLINLRGDANPAATLSGLPDGAPIYATLDVGIVRPDPTRVDPRYLTAWLNLPKTQAGLSIDREGTRVARLSLRALSDLGVPLPDLERQRSFGALHAEIARERTLRTRIAEARERLLYELLRRAAEEPAPGA